MQFLKRLFIKLGFGAETSRALLHMREELDDHLRAINENTDELQTNYALLAELHEKVDKLAGKMYHIEQMIGEPAERFQIKPLSAHEKEVFLALYTEEIPLTYAMISERTGMTSASVREHIGNLIDKGIPLVKTYVDGHPFLRLDRVFKERQTKENIVNCSLKAYVD